MVGVNDVSSHFPAKYDVAQAKANENGDEINDSEFDHVGFDGKANDPNRAIHRQKTNPKRDKRKKGKEKELTLKFSRYGNRDPPMHSNQNEIDESDFSNPKYGSQKARNFSGSPFSFCFSFVFVLYLIAHEYS